ncbi:hypothetical protein G6F21_014443 [Rhizopus arrhizus]|uniref:Uncharacterized protein n=1 Tax=Rhizopus oryzae TaxID=64495 RepID=A0A9P6WSJ4_RHIOR|nr:hypothetical protein G6F21_014443 [Rhizopus arrhizus]KAG1275265.1 hypothetical protein G6F64_014935 [Rhizopus arrhizus]
MVALRRAAGRYPRAVRTGLRVSGQGHAGIRRAVVPPRAGTEPVTVLVARPGGAAGAAPGQRAGCGRSRAGRPAAAGAGRAGDASPGR